MSYAPKGNAPSDRDPGWVRWAETETVSRLQDQLTSMRVQRELRRAAEPPHAPEEPQAPASMPPERSDGSNVAAMNAAPLPGDPAWHAWAEAQTVLRLRRPRTAPQSAPMEERPPPPPPTRDPLRVEVSSAPRAIRIHHENLKTVRLSEKESV